MRCRYNHDGDCCNSGAAQYMCKCKMPCVYIVPKTNADCIRDMTDKELALFLSQKYAKESVCRLIESGHNPTATEIKVLEDCLYMAWIRWLEQYAEEGE